MLKVENISKVFNKDTVNEKKAITNLNLHLNEGDFLTIIGSNGAGKSTLLNCIAGTYQIDDGNIVLDGNDITKLKQFERAKYIARVFQDPLLGTAADMEIQENLSLALHRGEKRNLRYGITNKEKELFKQNLSLLNLHLEDRLTSKVGLLSGGQRQGLTLLMATIKKPSLLLLDEHTAALDPITARNVLEITDKLVNENHITTIMVTHNMQDAIDYGNRLIMMNDGKIIFDISGEQKKKLKKEDLINKFAQITNSELNNDAMLLG
ncbi:MAG: ATP-binding cassette domain-containing protein [Erysipelotrichaceae bacterium]|nr:ATP-binding cassette domain-containing protein [Erysipelotrichaceae bacterium]MDY5727924.1 ATP-binding cassette domain-containing protein [Erysipelotrichaceae bacterium]